MLVPTVVFRHVARSAHSLFGAIASLVIVSAAVSQDWVFLDGPSYPGRMSAYDWSRQRLVVLGPDGATWEIAGSEVLARHALGSSPPPRTRGSMVYDFARDRVLLFGGHDVRGAMLDDTWLWDGVRWTQDPSPVRPPARVDAAITYDILRRRVVLYGGAQLFAGPLTDTWEHDGTRGVARNPSTVPGPNSPVMTYDILRQVSVMVTHSGIVGTPVTTWEWDGVDWSLRASTGPITSSNEGLGFDFARQRSVMFGGVGNQGQIWEWDGTTWQRFLVPTAPSRLAPAVHFDPSRGAIELLGGFDFVMSGSTVMQGSGRLDAYEWNGSTLTQLHGDLRPGSRYGHVLCADPNGDVMMFGGVVQQSATDQTWTWDGNAWTERQPLHRPSARSNAGAVFDSARGQTLVFGGNVGGQRPDETWAWDGNDWTLRNSGIGPAGRTEPALAYDSTRQVAILFGGFGPQSTPFTPTDDTWEWNGSIWTYHASPNSPSPRAGAAMAYDLFRQRTVLFGGRRGFTAQDQLNDTWEWNGSVWQPVATPTSPPALLVPSLYFELATGTLLLVGTSLASVPAQTQVWRYSAGTWTWVASSTNDQVGGSTAWEATRERVVSFKQTALAEWTSTPAQVAQTGPGCGAEIAVLATRSRPRLGSSSFGLETRGPASQPVVFAFATGPGPLLLGHGCTLWLDFTIVSAVTTTNLIGNAETRLAIPPQLWLRGLDLYAQASVIAPLDPLGFRLSQGIRFRIGD